MKKMNRREFLALTGAAVVALSLAGCDDEPYAPPAPPAPPAPTTSKETELVAAINKVWKEKYDAKAVVHEQLTLNQDAQEAIKIQGGIFENAKEPVHTLTTDDVKKLVGIQELKISLEKKYDLGGAAGISEPTGEDGNLEISLTFEYSCEDAVIQKFVNKIMDYSLSREAEFISIYCPVVQGKTYMIATVFWNKTA
ncbi:Tat pathway signal sequence [Faecalibacterium hattorii]|uniref:Tat pathway signal sequence n=1 Tax=Faecalibacterium hattorii TaxID=2935520 RepID=UPI003AAA9F69